MSNNKIMEIEVDENAPDPQKQEQAKQELANKNEPNTIKPNAPEAKEPVELIEISTQWQQLNPQFSQTKQLAFSQSQHANDFWRQQINNEPQDIFKALFPKKIVLSICNQLNARLKVMFTQTDESILKKKLYKPEQIYEYFGVKILMGYCRLPDPEDYFREDISFQGKIGTFMKEGRFKCVESWTKFNDEILLSLKQRFIPKSEFDDVDNPVEEIIPKLMKKINKIQRLACDAGPNLVLMRNNFFEQNDERSKQQIQCLLLHDARTHFILQAAFTTKPPSTALKMFSFFRSRNYRLYFQRHLLALEHVNHLVIQHSIYSQGILKPYQHSVHSDLATNGTVMVLRLRTNENNQLLASTADGFHRSSNTDKRSYATVQLQDHLKRAELYQSLSDQYRCQFSCIDLNGSLFTEVLEVIVWNSFCAYKEILRHDMKIEFPDFRILLAQQLLSSKFKSLKPELSIKTYNAVAIQTDRSGNYREVPRPPITSFHVPTQLVIPQKLKNSVACLVCKRSALQGQLTQCGSCCQVSGKLVSLCGNECFCQFHTNPGDFIENAGDLPQVQQQPQPVINQTQPVEEQYDQSLIAQSLHYQQSLQNRYPPQQQQMNYQNYPQQQQGQYQSNYQFQYDQEAFDDGQQDYEGHQQQQQQAPPPPPAPKKRGRKKNNATNQDMLQMYQNAMETGNQSYYNFSNNISGHPNGMGSGNQQQQQQVTGSKQISYSFVQPQNDL